MQYEDGQKFIKEVGVSYLVGIDVNGSITQDYITTEIPNTIFLDNNHKIVRKWAGLLTPEKLDELIYKHGLVPSQ